MHTITAKDQTYTVYTYAERPELEVATTTEDFVRQWPQFMYFDPVTEQHYPTMYGRYPEFQFYLQDRDGTPVACCNSIPVAWDGTRADLPAGWDDGLARGALGVLHGITPNTLCGVQATVSANFSGCGLGSALVQTMRKLASDRGFNALIAPVRPSVKARYPLTPIERYATWTRADGLLFDPWLRVHQRLGASILCTAPESMTVPGSVADWEKWADMRFPESGDYIVPGALVPVKIDCEQDQGLYVEPNVWMLHALNQS
jgi:GNAT superfamily N-acetyltransferase